MFSNRIFYYLLALGIITNITNSFGGLPPISSTNDFITTFGGEKIQCNTAATAQDGCLLSTDWNTFNTAASLINNKGSQNLNAGVGAGSAWTSGSSDTNVGYNAGTLQTTPTQCTNIGNLAGSSNVTGQYNTMVGNQAGASNLTGYNNYYGSGAGNFQAGNGTNTDGAAYNACFGTGACSGGGGPGVQTAWEITALGDYAGYSLTNGFSDVMIGTFAGQNTTSGTRDTFIGDFASYLNTSGSRNTSVGQISLYHVTTANDNAALGYISLGVATSSFNTAAGSNALGVATSGANNSCLGYNCLGNLTTSSDVTALGYQAGAGSGLTTLTQDTFLGDGTTASSNSLTNSTALGYGATITASNQIMLGNGSVTAILAGNAAATYNGLVQNNSTVTGATVDAALNTLKAQLQSVVFSALKNDGGALTANTEIPTWNTVRVDTLSGFNSSTGTYTVPAGLNGSNLTVSFNAATTTGTPKGQIYYNGSLYQTCIGSGVQTGCTAYIANVSTSDTVWVAIDNSLTLTSTNTDTNFSISAGSGASVGQVVKARYHGATGTITSSLSNISFSTKDTDSASAYSAPTFTIPATTGGGFYHYTACIYLTATTTAANQVATCAALDNGTIIKESTVFLSSTTTKPVQCCVTDDYQFAASDALTIQASLNGTTNSVSASNVFNVFSIEKVSN